MFGNARPVDVISVCTSDGKIRPLRVRLQDEDEQWVRIDIEAVLKVDEVLHTGAESQIFLCRATMWGIPRVFELKYSIRSHIWCIWGRYPTSRYKI